MQDFYFIVMIISIISIIISFIFFLVEDSYKDKVRGFYIFIFSSMILASSTYFLCAERDNDYNKYYNKYKDECIEETGVLIKNEKYMVILKNDGEEKIYRTLQAMPNYTKENETIVFQSVPKKSLIIKIIDNK